MLTWAVRGLYKASECLLCDSPKSSKSYWSFDGLHSNSRSKFAASYRTDAVPRLLVSSAHLNLQDVGRSLSDAGRCP